MIEKAVSCDIYFMTGTGNSYHAAKQFSGLASDAGYQVSISETDRLQRKDLKSKEHNGIIVFSYPTHGFCLPWHKLKFILKFPRGSGRVVLINNRAGLKMGKLFTPGLSGIALLLPMIVLILKGYRISAVVPHDTPSNWISVHPGVRKKIVDSIFAKRDGELLNVWMRIESGRTYYPLKFFILLPLDIFVAPISLGYIFFGRFLLARTYFADTRCDGCGICADRCPVQAIKMVNNRPWWTYKCESCMRCANICPKKAINSSVPLAVLYTILLFNISDIEFISGLITSMSLRLNPIPGKLVYYSVLWIITIVSTWGFYIVLFWLNRLKIFNHIIAFTSPMRYWRRYIAPGFRGLYK